MEYISFLKEYAGDFYKECLVVLSKNISLAVVLTSTKGKDALNTINKASRVTAKAFMRFSVYCSLAAAVCLVLLTMLFSSIVVSGALVGGVRHWYLSSVPGSRVIPLSFSSVPFITESWRGDSFQRYKYDALKEEGHGLSLSTSAGRKETLHDIQVSLVKQYAEGLLASSTFFLPQSKRGNIFTESGDVMETALFDRGPELFSSVGKYFAHVQVVLPREEVGRYISVVCRLTMLYLDLSETIDSLSYWDPLFERVESASVVSGPLEKPGRFDFVLDAAKLMWRLWFIVPIKLYEWTAPYFCSVENSPFPPIDPKREVSVVIPLYSYFVPPTTLQARLRAMNITLFRAGRDGPPVRVLRMNLHSSIELEGMAKYLTEYPVVTFVSATAILSGGVFFTLLLVVLLLAWMVYSAVQSKRAADREDHEEEIERSDFLFPRNKSFQVLPSNSAGVSRSNSFDSMDSLNFSRLHSPLSRSGNPHFKEE
ncbi:hypothetical protein ADEAN_000149500 [Angomonas deanei]|uniref:Uncharacterized protein n=1 Tax=Angomonas deanei TaxID=59799 RepID=A0A7G2C4C8_9TRYP|nr:hypothetical protein ADEAN_000149500 [Angomonas deanei]